MFPAMLSQRRRFAAAEEERGWRRGSSPLLCGDMTPRTSALARRLVAAALAVLAVATPWASHAQGRAMRPVVYELEGFLDQAPAGVDIQYTMQVGVGDQVRPLVVTVYRRLGVGNPSALFLNLGMHKPDYVLRGDSALIERLSRAAPGSAVKLAVRPVGRGDTLLLDPANFNLTPPAAATPEPPPATQD